MYYCTYKYGGVSDDALVLCDTKSPMSYYITVALRLSTSIIIMISFECECVSFVRYHAGNIETDVVKSSFRPTVNF